MVLTSGTRRDAVRDGWPGVSTVKQPRRIPVMSPEARAAMMALDTQIAAEDAQDFRREMRRTKAGLPEPPRRKITTFAHWCDMGLTPSGVATEGAEQR